MSMLLLSSFHGLLQLFCQEAGTTRRKASDSKRLFGTAQVLEQSLRCTADVDSVAALTCTCRPTSKERFSATDTFCSGVL